jgi:hypothetical protein
MRWIKDDFILLKSKSFNIGFLAGIILLMGMNIYSYMKNYAPTPGEEDFDKYQTFGFPFPIYESGTILHLDRFVWCGIVANFFIAICLSVGIGLLVTKPMRTENKNTL